MFKPENLCLQLKFPIFFTSIFWQTFLLKFAIFYSNYTFPSKWWLFEILKIVRFPQVLRNSTSKCDHLSIKSWWCRFFFALPDGILCNLFNYSNKNAFSYRVHWNRPSMHVKSQQTAAKVKNALGVVSTSYVFRYVIFKFPKVFKWFEQNIDRFEWFTVWHDERIKSSAPIMFPSYT